MLPVAQLCRSLLMNVPGHTIVLINESNHKMDNTPSLLTNFVAYY